MSTTQTATATQIPTVRAPTTTTSTVPKTTTGPSATSPTNAPAVPLSTFQQVIDAIKSNPPSLIFIGVFAAYCVMAMMRSFVSGLFIAGAATILYSFILPGKGGVWQGLGNISTDAPKSWLTSIKSWLTFLQTETSKFVDEIKRRLSGMTI